MKRYYYETPNKSSLIVVTSNDKHGIFNCFTLEEVIPPMYEHIKILSDDCFAVMLNGFWGVVNYNNEWIIKPMYNIVKKFSDSHLLYGFSQHQLALATKCGKYSTQAIYSEFSYLKNGFTLVRKHKNWGILNEELKEVVPTTYNFLRCFKDNLFIAYKDNEVFIIDCYNNIEQKLSYNMLIKPSNSSPYFIAIQDNHWGILDENLNEVIKPSFDNIWYLYDDYFQIKLNDCFGVLNIKNGIIIEPLYANVTQLIDNIFVVKNNQNNFALFDSNGKQLTEFKYNNIYLNNKTIFATTKRNSHSNYIGILDKTGKETLRPIYDNIEKLDDGYVVFQDGKAGICDSKFNVVSKIVFDKVLSIHETTKNGKKNAVIVYDGIEGTVVW